ncbi:hypothetical protein [Streptomyces sp. NPDC002644]
MAEAHDLIVDGLRGRRPGRYAQQAAIVSLCAEAPSYDRTDWPRIVSLYDTLLSVWRSPAVALNRTGAVSMVSGPARALAEVTALEKDSRLARYQYPPAIKADLLRRLGRPEEAALACRQALELTENDTERAFLTERRQTARAVRRHWPSRPRIVRLPLRRRHRPG